MELSYEDKLHIVEKGCKKLANSISKILLTDHILTNTNEKIAQCGLINLRLSDHQTIFCIRKTKTEKVGVHKQFLLGHLKSIQLMSMKRLYVK